MLGGNGVAGASSGVVEVRWLVCFNSAFMLQKNINKSLSISNEVQASANRKVLQKCCCRNKFQTISITIRNYNKPV